MGPKKDKKPLIDPGIKTALLGKKVPKVHLQTGQNYDGFCPSWCLHHADNDGPFAWSRITGEDAKEALLKMIENSKRSWAEILRESKKQNHGIEVKDIERDAQDRLRVLKLDDYDRVHTLHLNGKQRIWYIKEDHYAFLLWWDPEHKVCPSMLKHT